MSIGIQIQYLEGNKDALPTGSLIVSSWVFSRAVLAAATLA